MHIHWDEITSEGGDIPAAEAPIRDKTTLVGRVGSMMLSCGTSAWRVRTAMNRISRKLGMTCNVDIGLTTLVMTCFEKSNHYTLTVSLPSTGINTDKIKNLEAFVDVFQERSAKYSVRQLHEILDSIEKKKSNYSAWQLGLASAFACAAFTFLLGGRIYEMLFAFFGAGVGNFVRKKLLERKISLFANVALAVASACATYALLALLFEKLFGLLPVHHAGYICAMLFIIPGFPLITGGIDLAKLDLKSGLERITYAVLVILVATLTGWATALMFNFNPEDFEALHMSTPLLFALRLIASFIGVYGFSLMFNSTARMALTAGLIGMTANVLRFVIIDFTSFPAALAAFLGALCAGLMASVVSSRVGIPRISVTVPSIVIMVPGMLMYKAVYFLGTGDITSGSSFLINAVLIVISLPLGLVFARFITDPFFRHSS